MPTGNQGGIHWSGSVLLGWRPLSGFPQPLSHPRPLGCHQPVPPHHIQIRHAATDEQPVRVLRQPTIADFGPPEDSRDHQERRFDFRPHLRLRAGTSPRSLPQRPMTMRFRLDAVLGVGGMVLNHVTLPTVGRVAPHPCFLSVQQG